MTIYALVGKSGTGKSFRAKLIAEQYALTAIIDDGLLIQDEKIVAGKSAKHEKTYMGAVRVALFDDKEHRDAVAKAIQKQNVKKILIIGTSEKMVQKISSTSSRSQARRKSRKPSSAGIPRASMSSPSLRSRSRNPTLRYSTPRSGTSFPMSWGRA